MKKIVKILAVVFSTSVIVGSSFVINNNKSIFSSSTSQHTSTCQWNHYDFTAPSYEDNGNNEYWVCCNHHEYTLTAPTVGNITDKGELSSETRNSFSDSDERVILSYKKQVKFLTDQIDELDENSISVADIKKINKIENQYNELSDTLKEYVKNYQDFLGFKYTWDSLYDTIVDGHDYAFSRREYSHSTFTVTNSTDTELNNTITLSDIDTVSDDTFWIYPFVDKDLSSYSDVTLFVKSQTANIVLGFRAKTDYSTKKSFTCNAGTWTQISIHLEDYDITNLNEIGIARWVNGSAFTISTPLEFSSFYGTKNEADYSNVIFDASTESFVNNIYAATYTQTHVSDEDKGTVVCLSNMSNTTDTLWFKPNKYQNITNYQYIMFFIKSSKEMSFCFRASSNYNLVYEGFHVEANTWTKVVFEINDWNFPNGLISDLGIAHWKQHSVGEAGNWYISSIYGLGHVDLEGAEIVDGIKVPLITSENNIDFTAYATPHCTSSNGDKIFTQAKQAGFTKAIGLLDGRDSTTQEAFRDALESYLTIIKRTDKKKTALKTAIADYCAAVETSNQNCVYYANKNGIGYYALAEILYDYRDFMGDKSYTNDDYNLIASEVWANSTYITSAEYYGQFMLDEPSLTDDLSKYATAINSYKTYSSGEPLINLLPHDNEDTRSSYNTYVDNYFSTIFPLLGYVSYDCYPLRTTGITNTHLVNLEIFAQKIKSTGYGQLRTFINSNSATSGTIMGNDSLSDLRFQIYSNLAFGSNDIAYFCYTSNNDPSTGTTGSLVNYSSYETSDLYNYASTVNHEVQNFGLAYNHFTWDASIAYGSSTPISKVENDVSTYGVLTNKSCTTDTLIGCFKDDDDLNAFLVMNYQDPNNATASDTVTLTLDNSVDTVIVYQGGEKHAYRLDNGTATLNLDVGEGAFVIPVKAL